MYLGHNDCQKFICANLASVFKNGKKKGSDLLLKCHFYWGSGKFKDNYQ